MLRRHHAFAAGYAVGAMATRHMPLMNTVTPPATHYESHTPLLQAITIDCRRH